jgi:hypothetical protein
MTGWILLQDTVCVVVISSIILLKLYIKGNQTASTLVPLAK